MELASACVHHIHAHAHSHTSTCVHANTHTCMHTHACTHTGTPPGTEYPPRKPHDAKSGKGLAAHCQYQNRDSQVTDTRSAMVLMGFTLDLYKNVSRIKTQHYSHNLSSLAILFAPIYYFMRIICVFLCITFDFA